jgi:hypothetical protein
VNLFENLVRIENIEKMVSSSSLHRFSLLFPGLFCCIPPISPAGTYCTGVVVYFAL